jgi:hypothetical protein
VTAAENLARKLHDLAAEAGWRDVSIDARAADPSTGQPELLEVARWTGHSCPFVVQFEEDLFVVEFGSGSRIELSDEADLNAVIDALLNGRVEERVWRRGGELRRADAIVDISSGSQKRVVTRHGLFVFTSRQPTEVNRYEGYA